MIVSKTGKDGGYDGSIRQSGGKIGERGSVLEDSYFRKKVGKLNIIRLLNELGYSYYIIIIKWNFVLFRMKLNYKNLKTD